MNRLAWAAILSSVFLISRDSQARPPYPAMFMDEYMATPGVVAAAKGAKCNVCHDAASKTKKDRNEYGKALNKHLTAGDFNALKGAKPVLAGKVSAALKSAEQEKNSTGEKFGDIIKAGKLPAP